MTHSASASLTNAQLATLRGLLVAEQRRLRGEAAIPSAVAEAGPRESDPSDEATDSLIQHEALAGSQHAERLLTEVEAALARMDAGTYGTSEVSGEPIGYARLSAVPWARFSVVEQEDLERIERR
jgi:RNA polymerase-binding transcription factor